MSLSLAHASAGLIAAMRACPWGYDTEPDTTAANLGSSIEPYDANQRPACAKWKAGDRVLAPWFRKSTGLVMYYERTSGERAGEIVHAFHSESRRRLAAAVGFDLLDAGDGFKLLESREAWHYSDPRPGIEAITCRLCLRTILEVQGARADFLAERLAAEETRGLEHRLNLERGICPTCLGPLAPAQPEDPATVALTCWPCGLSWRFFGGDNWQLLNATNRGTHAHT